MIHDTVTTYMAMVPRMGTGWNPWRALREQPDVRLVWADLPDGMDGVAVAGPDGQVVAMDPHLHRVERNAVLAHELIHLDRGVLGGSPLTMQTEEERVRRETARRLVPLDQLAACPRVRSGDPVTAADVAACFDVPVEVAEQACRLLLGG